MEGSHKIIAIDIGSTFIKGILAEYNYSTDKVDIFACESMPAAGVVKGIINNITEVSHDLQQLINNLLIKTDHTVSAVIVALKDSDLEVISHKFTINRTAPHRPINHLEINQILRRAYRLDIPPSKVIMHVEPINYNLDNQNTSVNPIGMLATHLEAQFDIILGNETTINNLYKCLSKIDLNTEEGILSCIASADAVLLKEEKEAGAIVINLGSQTTELLIFNQGILRYFSVIPFGSALITKDIAESLQILPRQAENLKINYGAALSTSPHKPINIPNVRGESVKTISSKELNYIIQLRVEEIFSCALEEINKSALSAKLLGGIVLTGGGAKLTNLYKLAKHIFKLPIRIGNSADNIEGNYIPEVSDPIFSTAVGLLINSKKNIAYQPLNTVKVSNKKRVNKWFDKILKKGIIAELLNTDTNDKDFIK